MIKVELNITMRCNQACANCNRLCNIFRDRTEDMSIQQIEKFVSEIRGIGGIDKVKVLGGEPLLHPHFTDIYKILCSAADEGLIRQIKIDTNQTVKRPTVSSNAKVRWMGRHPKRKEHIPALWSPEDIGLKSKGPCKMIGVCGFSLDKYGWLPCSSAIMIARMFNLQHLYRKNIQTKPWGMDELCKYCVFGLPEEWRISHRRPVSDSSDTSTPTRSWQEAISRYSWPSIEEY